MKERTNNNNERERMTGGVWYYFLRISFKTTIIPLYSHKTIQLGY